ncbi:MAG TPA: glycoside hydrolase family 3 N-terminal domain-containing protein [Puia sp.]
MSQKKFLPRFFSALVVILMLTSVILLAGYKSSEKDQGENIHYVKNPKGGPVLGYAESSGVKIIEQDGLLFKDLNKNGKLDPYEDWRLPVDARAGNLASLMSVEQIAGLMLYSRHQAIPAGSKGLGAGTYNGKPFNESGAQPSDLTDQQLEFLTKDNLRHILVTTLTSPEVAATWNNHVQALVEGIGLGIPANNSSDPRNSANATTEYNAGAGGKISMWPEQLGLAATFDPTLVQKFGNIAAREYRALGITTALSPQIDLGTEPRWVRINGTFGEDPKLSEDMARAYVDGFQTSLGAAEIHNGWGYQSVNAMIKHWPGGGPEEGGRDAHFAYGKFAVYPGNNLDEQLVPFVDGGLNLSGKTKTAAAVMPYYTISFSQDQKNFENVGNGYSRYLVKDLLRGKYHYDGVVCTDWLVTADEGKTPDIFAGKSWGMEIKSVAERHYKVLMAGVDQFGGNNVAAPVIEAYQMGVKEHGEKSMRSRFEQSAVRLLRNIFRLGLFENPYLVVEESKQTVGNPQFMLAGYNAQLKSVVMLKNKSHLLPLHKGITVFIPKRFTASRKDFFGNITPEKWEDALNPELAKKYFIVTDDPSKADVAIVFVSSPDGGPGYDKGELANPGGNGYVPISLQFGPYTANDARSQSMASGDPAEPEVKNRSYKNKSVRSGNEKDLQSILDTKKLMNGKPVIVAIALSKPAVMQEFESQVNAIVASFGVQNQAILDIITGDSEPSGLLPLQMPANMQTVEAQYEDVPHDMLAYTDSEGNTYDFGFGVNWKGVIHDQRTTTYVNIIKPPLITVRNNLVTISCNTPGVQIYFTLNDSIPSFTKSNLYAKPFQIIKTQSVRAIAKKPGFNNSTVSMYKPG